MNIEFIIKIKFIKYYHKIKLHICLVQHDFSLRLKCKQLNIIEKM
jgi:hypothetical protein